MSRAGAFVAAFLLCLAGGASAETLDECAAKWRAELAPLAGGRRGKLADYYPLCRELAQQAARREAAEAKARAQGAADPAKAAEKQLQLENCLGLPNPTWEGKVPSREWWVAHCRWYTGQPGAKRPPEP